MEKSNKAAPQSLRTLFCRFHVTVLNVAATISNDDVRSRNSRSIIIYVYSLSVDERRNERQLVRAKIQRIQRAEAVEG